MPFPRRRVLVVEDDPDIRKLIRKYLEKLDLDVDEAATGKAALDLLRRNRHSLVCLDLMLPESSGYQICEHIRATPHLAATRVLVISARSMPPDRALAEEAGADAYLMKPIRWASFSSVVSSLLDAV